MKKIIKINEITQVVVNMETTLESLKQKKTDLETIVSELEVTDKSDNITTIVSNFRDNIAYFNNMIEKYEYYMKFINEIMSAYDSKFSDFKQKLKNLDKELGGHNE